MNTLFALYLWLMQIFGVPGVICPPGIAHNSCDAQVATYQTAPPPPEDEDDGQQPGDRKPLGFISNGF